LVKIAQRLRVRCAPTCTRVQNLVFAGSLPFAWRLRRRKTSPFAAPSTSYTPKHKYEFIELRDSPPSADGVERGTFVSRPICTMLAARIIAPSAGVADPREHAHRDRHTDRPSIGLARACRHDDAGAAAIATSQDHWQRAAARAREPAAVEHDGQGQLRAFIGRVLDADWLQSLCAGICQLLATHPSPAYWSLQCSGVVVLVKDYTKRAYFIRIYDLYKRIMLWEQQLCVAPAGC